MSLNGTTSLRCWRQRAFGPAPYEKLKYRVFDALEDYPPGLAQAACAKPDGRLTRMQPATPLPDRAKALLDFWFGPPDDPAREQHREIWFKSTNEFDDALRREFLGEYEAAAAGRLWPWEASPEAALALVLLLDQVPRNIFRRTPRAYVADATAL